MSTAAIEAKVVLLGSASVGKTCIVTRATSDFFDPEQVSTVGASFSAKTIQTETARVTLRIWDTAGQERFRSLAPMYFQGAQAAVVVFSLTSKDTLEDSATWVEELKTHFETLPVLYLVGNKADLTEEKCISIEEANEMAERLHAIYFETSAKTGQNVNELFEDIADHMQNNEVKVDTNNLQPVLNENNKKSQCC
ncbi:small GTP-binding protein [Tritrichomonas foetus]|uniref:Small GTP-binding protein n=1 Tax=Tritrichomonas foetus TaxID=1144522 RepID=A0A1J4JB24_9EUKA|nr:small GTP-binding protein [Tritrichomonas foetus]|eukprot:OHS94452.1 small GTP-binding protein [Tritrichomonas foetus]